VDTDITYRQMNGLKGRWVGRQIDRQINRQGMSKIKDPVDKALQY